MASAGIPWPAGAATGIGSLPGTDIVESQRMVLGELPDLPHLPELPARGPGADMIGRGAALLAELPVELYAARWRLAGRPGHDLRVARDYLERDLDTLTGQAPDFDGTFKIQAVGPWTLAAAIELPSGGPALRDPGAARDLAAALADGVRAHVGEVCARLPRASVLLQLDEASLPAVLGGRVPTASGLGTLPTVEPVVARAALASVIEAAGVPVVVHCCASDAPLGLLAEAGARGAALDLRFVGGSEGAAGLDALGAVIDAGLGLFAGAVDTRVPSAGRPPSAAAAASLVRRVWRDVGFPPGRLASQVVVTPACGLAGATAGWARAALAACRDAGRRLAEDAE